MPLPRQQFRSFSQVIAGVIEVPDNEWVALADPVHREVLLWRRDRRRWRSGLHHRGPAVRERTSRGAVDAAGVQPSLGLCSRCAPSRPLTATSAGALLVPQLVDLCAVISNQSVALSAAPDGKRLERNDATGELHIDLFALDALDSAATTQVLRAKLGIACM